MNKAAYEVVLGLGSNLHYPSIQLKQAIHRIQHLPASQLLRASSFYLNPPVGPKFQPWFINAVVCIKTRLAPLILLRKLQRIEKRQQRKRRKHWGPRTLDIDILLYKNKRLHYKKLIVPHPFMLQRSFVMWPLYEIAPDLIMPNRVKITTLIQQVPNVELVKLSKNGKTKYTNG